MSGTQYELNTFMVENEERIFEPIREELVSHVHILKCGLCSPLNEPKATNKLAMHLKQEKQSQAGMLATSQSVLLGREFLLFQELY